KSLESVLPYAKQRGVSINLAETRHATIHADEERLIRILVDLLTNETELCPSNSTITIGLVEHENEMEISIEDEAPPIPFDLKEKILDPLQAIQLERAYTGSGLGFAGCKVLLESLGATLAIDSPQNRGRRILIRLRSDHCPPDIRAGEKEL